MNKFIGIALTINFKIVVALFLSFIAGLINVVGLLSINILTTNITGHFAFFVGEVFNVNLVKSLIYFIFILSFLLGAFISNIILEIHYRKSKKKILIVPIIIEIIILIIISIFGNELKDIYPNIIACILLFVMGLQNSFATRITNSMVRTTHLTGLFTDLGIELAQLFFKSTEEETRNIKSSIELKFIIIISFFIGGILGAIFYSKIGFDILYLGIIILIGGLLYYYFKKVKTQS